MQQAFRLGPAGFGPLIASPRRSPASLTTVTWNPADKYANVTLSNGNKTATGLTGVGGAQCCRATVSQTSGKWYYEVRVDTLVSQITIGLDNGTTGVSALTIPGQHDSNGICYYADSGGANIYFQNNGGFPPGASGLAAGDVIGVAVDAGTGQTWLAKNNVWTSGDPGLGTGGYASGISTFYPYIGPLNADAGTGRWAAADQSYAVPSGFTAWDAGVSADVTIALTGQTVTASQGALTPAVSFALAGQSLSAAQGQVLQGAPLVGQNISAAQGSVTAGVTIALVGQSISAAQGTLTAAPSVALAGQAITASRGTLSPSFSFALTGSGIAASKGALAPAFSVTLTGQSLTAARGTTLPSSSLPLLGAGAVVAQGIVSVTAGGGPWTISALPTGAWSIESNPTSIWTISPTPSNRLA